MKSILIIDTFNLLFRSYYAMRHFRSSSGAPNGMLFGLANKLYELKDAGFSRVIFAADSPGGSFRNKILPEYKANRKELEPELKVQIPLALQMLKTAGYILINRENYEADDVIASLAKTAQNLGAQEIYIASSDKDLYSLINERTKILTPDGKIASSAECIAKFGVEPAQIRDYLALIGDSSDNFKGVPGIGPAAAKRLLGEFGDLEQIYANLERTGTKSVVQKLTDGKESAYLSQKLATLVDDLDVGEAFTSQVVPLEVAYANLADEFGKYSLLRHARAASALRDALGIVVQKPHDFGVCEAPAVTPQNREDFEGCAAPASELFSAELISSADELFDILRRAPEQIGFDTETTGLERSARCVGFSFAFFEGEKLRAFYVPLAHKSGQNIPTEPASEAIKMIFSRTVIGHNLAFDFRVIEQNFAISPPESFKDSMLLAWLARSDDKLSLDAQSKKLFAHENVAFSELVGKDENFSDLPVSQAYFYAAEDAAMSLKIAKYYEANLSELELKIAQYEFKFARVLFRMQENGILCSRGHLLALELEFDAELAALLRTLCEIAGEKFNPASPKQVAEVLYDKLALKAPKNRSTAEQSIRELEHPIIAPLLSYRELAKLQGTYVRALLDRASSEEFFCVRADFSQTGTATGRLACSRPNLQNLPASGRGLEIKRAFCARAGCVFVSLDYSQIELRMLAHFSGDAALVSSFMRGDDIHALTARECFGDESFRQMAKAINFGLIYGMGARSLARDIGTSAKEAANYIETYFARFSNVRKFFAAAKEFARTNGYITTISGRRRYFNYGNSVKEDNAHDRECINSILQGSAADLIKIAMIKVHEQLLNERARLLLQVHDELIFEVDEEIAHTFCAQAGAIMQNAAAMRVPLLVSSAIGKSLADLK